LRGLLELARRRHEDALAAFVACERPGERIVVPEMLATPARALTLLTLVCMGQPERTAQLFGEIGEKERESAELRIVLAALRLAQDDPQEAAETLAPLLEGSLAAKHPSLWLLLALVLEARARDALGDSAATHHAVERALDLAEPDGTLLPFILYPVPELLERHRRNGTAHASLVVEILSLLAGNGSASVLRDREPLREPLSECETRVLRYLPTNLSAPEIAGELCLAVTTVKTHLQHIYAKLGVHRRGDAVERARVLGLLAPSALKAK
jgi:LuxR family maltose regulon positive regulatory protein